MPDMRDDTLKVLKTNFPNSAGQLEVDRSTGWLFWKKSAKPVPAIAPAQEREKLDVPKPE